ncbi:MAG: hypothetical protein ACOZCL_13260 [Bacillota bacterium]
MTPKNTLRKLSFIVFLCMLLNILTGGMLQCFAASIIYVDDDNTSGIEDGTMSKPYKSIQAAVDRAVNGDVIQVAAGSYTAVSIKNKSITLAGGYKGANATDYGNGAAGDFTARSLQVYVAHIAGNGQAAAVSIIGNSSIIDGFRITGGNPGISINGEAFGGRPIIKNNIIENNGSSTIRGGGINSSSWYENLDIVVKGNIIRSNQAARGGAIYTGDHGQLLFENNTVEYNIGHGDHGGGIAVGSNAIITGNIVRYNEVGNELGYGWGGGIICFGTNKTVSLSRNIVYGNYAPSGGGGEFMDEGVIAVISNELIYANLNSKNGSGNIYYPSGLIFGGSGPYANYARTRGTVTNCTIAGNQGGGIWVHDDSDVTIENSILWYNQADNDFRVSQDMQSSLSISYTNSKEDAAGQANITVGEGNTHVDPLFADAQAGDYHLSAYSTLIDAGNPLSSFENEPEPNGGRVDMGAYGNTLEAGLSGSTAPDPAPTAAPTPAPTPEPTPTPTSAPEPASEGCETIIFSDEQNFTFTGGSNGFIGKVSETEGLNGTPCLKYTLGGQWGGTPRLHFSSPIDISKYGASAKLEISMDLGAIAPNDNSIQVRFNNDWATYVTVSGIDNTAGYQTFSIELGEARSRMGSSINDIYFASANGFISGGALLADNISITSGVSKPTPTPEPTPTPIPTPEPSPEPTPSSGLSAQGAHPRIWLDSAVMSDLAGKALASDPAWVALRQKANSFINDTVYYPDGPAYPDGIGAGYHGDTYYSSFMPLALAYKIGKEINDPNTNLWKDKAIEILERASHINDIHEPELTSNQMYGIRFYGPVWTIGYDWLYEALSEPFREQLVSCMNHWLSLWPEYGLGRDTEAQPYGNFYAGYYATYAYAAIATDGENAGNPDIWYDFMGIHNSYVQPYFETVGEGGGWPEGWAYGYRGMMNMILPALAVKTGKGIDLTKGDNPYTYPIEQSLHMIHFTWPDRKTMEDHGTLRPYNYGNGAHPSEAKQGLFTVAAALASAFDDPNASYLQSFTRLIRGIQNNQWYTEDKEWIDMLFWDEAAPEADFTALPLSYKASGLGEVAMRSDWSTDAVWAAFKAAPYANAISSGEQLFDQGSLSIVKGDTPFLVNTYGCSATSYEGTSYLSEHDAYANIYTGERDIFNVFYNGYGQKWNGVNTDYKAQTELTRYEDFGSFVQARAEKLEDMYYDQWEPQYNVDSWTRDMIYIRPGIFIVYDRTNVNQNNDQRMNWHTFRSPELVSTENGITRYDISNTTNGFIGSISTLYPAAHNITIENVFESDKIYRLEIRPDDIANSQKWLTVFDAAASADQVAAAHRLSAEEGNCSSNVIGALLEDQTKNYAVLFDAGDANSTVTGTISLTIPLKDTQCIISGLQPNTSYTAAARAEGSSMIVTVSAGTGMHTSTGGTLDITFDADTLTAVSNGKTYLVGPSREYRQLSEIASLLEPGDTVLVDGDAVYNGGVVFEESGLPDARITIKGVSINGRRPLITGGINTVEFIGNHYIFEGFEITGGTSRGIYHHNHDLTINDCVIHDCPAHGIISSDYDSGSIIIRNTEVYACGSGTSRHQLYIATDEERYPNAVFRLEFCYIHDGNGGNNIKSRAARNEIYYNWIEDAYYHNLELIGPDIYSHYVDDALVREDGDVVGNVIINTDRDFYLVRIGGDGTGQSFGQYRFINNTFIQSPSSTRAVFRIFDGIESLEASNNIFTKLSGYGVRIYTDSDAEWVNGVQITGTNNWVQTSSTSIPSGWSGTLSGNDAGFEDASILNLNPGSNSPLIDNGTNAVLMPIHEPPIRTKVNYPEVEDRIINNGKIDIGAYEY